MYKRLRWTQSRTNYFGASVPSYTMSAYFGHPGDTSDTRSWTFQRVCATVAKKLMFSEITSHTVVLPRASREGHTIVYCEASGRSELR